MFTSTAQVHIPADPEVIWPLVSQPERHHEWRDELVSMTLEEGEPGNVGAVYREVIEVGPREIPSRFRVTASEELRRFEFETFEPEWIPSTNTIELTSDGAGTTVTFESANRTKGWRALVEPVWKVLFDRSLKRELTNLRDTVAG